MLTEDWEKVTANPLFSVIMTVYDRVEFYPEAIKSVASQDIELSQVELIIVTNLEEIGTTSQVRQIAGTTISESTQSIPVHGHSDYPSPPASRSPQGA